MIWRRRPGSGESSIAARQPASAALLFLILSAVLSCQTEGYVIGYGGAAPAGRSGLSEALYPCGSSSPASHRGPCPNAAAAAAAPASPRRQALAEEDEAWLREAAAVVRQFLSDRSRQQQALKAGPDRWSKRSEVGTGGVVVAANANDVMTPRQMRTASEEYKLMSQGDMMSEAGSEDSVAGDFNEREASYPFNRRLRFDPTWMSLLRAEHAQDEGQAAAAAVGAAQGTTGKVRRSGGRLAGMERYGKRNQYMLLRKGRDTTSEEEELELIGVDEDGASQARDTVKEQERISKLQKRETPKNLNDSEYLLRFVRKGV